MKPIEKHKLKNGFKVSVISKGDGFSHLVIVYNDNKDFGEVRWLPDSAVSAMLEVYESMEPVEVPR